jgi:membrane-associated protease RseP (regulator of RpoE activity)
MNIYLWITLLIIVIFIALVQSAARSGWMERHNMSLAMGMIVMWRTQRGKDLIDKLSGRATDAELVRKRIMELEPELDEANEALEKAKDDQRLVEVVKEYRSISSERASLIEASDPANDERINELTYELSSREDLVAPQSKFRDLLKDMDDSEVTRELDEILEASVTQQSTVDQKVSSIKLELSDRREDLVTIERSPEFPKQQRQSRRRVRFWRGYGNIAIGIVMVFMFVMFALLVWQSFIVVRIPPGVIQPQQMLGIPGVNPVIPLWYGIFGLAVAMLVHEFAHGILARAGKITVKSLGILYMVVPIGAFVEPDEDQLAQVDRGRRSRVFAVGPATNILVAFLVVMIFGWGFMGSLEQAEEGTVLNFIIDEQTVTVANDTEAIKQTPASKAGLLPWSTLMSIEALDGPPLGPDGENLSVLKDNDDFQDTMARSHGGQKVRLSWYHNGNYRTANVTLWDKGEVYGDEYSGQGYLGAGSRLLYEVPAGEYPDALARPMTYVDDVMSFRNMTFFYISLPFTRPALQPPSEAITQAYEVNGPLANLGDTGFWVVANLLYWIFWLNMMVGIFNALPAIPLDGGYIFRDGFSWLIQKMKPTRKRDDLDSMATKVTMTISLLILFLILWQFIGPWMGSLIGTN